jgi:membrane fusion protein (multidrug efflux system)
MNYIKKISVILISTLLVAGCSSKKATDSTSVVEKALVPVKVLGLAKTKIARTIDYSATALPYEEVNMAPSTPGRIDKIYVEVGDRVKKGDDLFLMDRTQLFQLKLQLSSLEKDLNRLDTLLKVGSAKQQQYDQLKTQYDIAKTNVDYMEENTLVKAPYSGVITGKYFENGEMYSGSPTTQTGRAAVVTLMQLDPLKVNVGISEQYYPLIKKNMVASIKADVYENESFTGKVTRIYPTINSSTRSFIVELEVPNSKELLKPGMFVRVSMELGEVETFVVPANTVLVQEGTNTRYVFISDNGTAKRVNVILGKRFDDKIEILSDNIKEGDLLVNEGQAKLITGDKIDITR